MVEEYASRIRAARIQVEASHKHNADIPTPEPGEHMWVAMAMYHLHHPDRDQVLHLDLENLITLAGPACFVCEQPWSPELAARRCSGEPAGAAFGL